MDSYRTTNLPGSIAPADGNVPAPGQARVPRVVSRQDVGETEDEVADNFEWMEDGGGAKSGGRGGIGAGVETVPVDLGPNNERLADVKPKLVNALRELVRQYSEEGIAARRYEIRRIRQARLFWQGLQYAWWNPNDMNWHLPFEQKFNDDRALEEMPRYQFVTNFYQGFGLSFIAVLSQDVPGVRFYPQSAQSLTDISAARAASDVAALIEQNNHIEQLLTSTDIFCGRMASWARMCAMWRMGSGLVFTTRIFWRHWKFRWGGMFTFARDAGKKLRRIRFTASIRKKTQLRRFRALETERRAGLLVLLLPMTQTLRMATAREEAARAQSSQFAWGAARNCKRKICGGRNGLRCRG